MAEWECSAPLTRRTPKGFRGFDPHSLRQFDPIVQWTEPAASIRLIQVRLLFGSPPLGPLAQWSEPAAHNSQGAGSSPAGPKFPPMDNQNPVDSGQPATVNLDSRIGSRQHAGSLSPAQAGPANQ